jgi:hypothetical protein
MAGSASKTTNRGPLPMDFRAQCWAVTVALGDRTDEDEFRVTISLLELGQNALGRALGRDAVTAPGPRAPERTRPCER